MMLRWSWKLEDHQMHYCNILKDKIIGQKEGNKKEPPPGTFFINKLYFEDLWR